MEEKKKRWRPSLTAYRELQKELAETKEHLDSAVNENRTLRHDLEIRKKIWSIDTVPAESYNILEDKVSALDKSNKLLDDEIERLKNRSLWDRIWNNC